ncbi:MAG: hypothetical protein K2H85_01025, partial [Allobaculum sp.]|nr:hypothetical protein [Allobaculum sp.]
MDEKNGMNYSEYVAILSGNTDLLEKAKLEKRIASLESERKAHSEEIKGARFKLQTLSNDIANCEIAIKGMREDLRKYEMAMKRDEKGRPLNGLTLDNCRFHDIENMGVHLQGLAGKITSIGEYRRVGEVYGFPISIISEKVDADGREKFQNRFVVEGNFKYKYNNGLIAMNDTRLACMNFVNALEKIPDLIDVHENRLSNMRADLPVLQSMVTKTWSKETELKELKSELVVIERKITDSLAPSKNKMEAFKSLVKNENISLVRDSETDKWHIRVSLGERKQIFSKELGLLDYSALRSNKSSKMEMAAKYLSEDIFKAVSEERKENNQTTQYSNK